MIPSIQNIDDTDHYKITSTAGYMDIKHVDLSGVKNEETFNDAIIKAFENSTGVEYERSCKRLAVIINGSDRVRQAIDSRLDVIKRYCGEPFEVYRHIQQNPMDNDDYIDIIVCGINMPMKAVQDMNKKFQDMKSKAKTGVKPLDFSGIDLEDDDEFNVGIRKRNTNVNSLFAATIGGGNTQQPKQQSSKDSSESAKNNGKKNNTVVTIIKNNAESEY
jgi:hypothetical protein